jgi:hypothetical protein
LAFCLTVEKKKTIVVATRPQMGRHLTQRDWM